MKIGPAFKLDSALNNILCLAKWKQGDSCLGVGNLRPVPAGLRFRQGGCPGSEPEILSGNARRCCLYTRSPPGLPRPSPFSLPAMATFASLPGSGSCCVSISLCEGGRLDGWGSRVGGLWRGPSPGSGGLTEPHFAPRLLAWSFQLQIGDSDLECRSLFTGHVYKVT